MVSTVASKQEDPGFSSQVVRAFVWSLHVVWVSSKRSGFPPNSRVSARTHCSSEGDESNAGNKFHCTSLCMCDEKSIINERTDTILPTWYIGDQNIGTKFCLKPSKSVWIILVCTKVRDQLSICHCLPQSPAAILAKSTWICICKCLPHVETTIRRFENKGWLMEEGKVKDPLGRGNWGLAELYAPVEVQ